MFPMYGDVNSCPGHENQAPSSQFYYPIWDSFPPQMKENQTNHPQMHEYWPPNYPYPTPMPMPMPMPCQNCFTHAQIPSYYNFRPPCPHFPPPPPYAHYYPPPYPYVPPLHFSTEMPRYEYHRSSPNTFHCCECPNHPSHVKSSNNLKIEEHDPDVESKKSESLVPAGVSNSPYPTLWFPPEYMMNKEQPRRVVKSDADEQPSQSIQAVGKDPNGRYQWFPLDMNSIRELMECGKVMKPLDQEKKGVDEKKPIDSAQKAQNKPFSYPIVWMPYDAKEESYLKGQEERNIGKTPADDKEERNNDQRAAEGCPSTFNVVKHPVNNELVKETKTGEKSNGAGTRGSHKTGNVRIIPVKQLDDSVPTPFKKEEENTANGCSKKAGEIAKNGTDMKPSPLTKKSKLPPICLRVDPPRKRNGKGSSRSPSPPDEKKHHEPGDSKDDRKDRELKSGKGEVNVDNDHNGMKEQEKQSSTQDHQSEGEAKAVQDSNSSNSDDTKRGHDGLLHAPEGQGMKGSEHDKTSVPVRNIMSVMEAAVIIQSAYRGYVVRRWEPLKKLRQIANVREEATKVKTLIEKLEACATIDHKEKVAIGETIMSLLLKLDTLQGLHPSVRDVRKSVANELVLLQEKLDSIGSQTPMLTDQCNPTFQGVEHPAAFGSEGDPAVSLENFTDASKISEHGEASDANMTVQTLKASEEADPSEVPSMCSSTGNELFEVNEESGRQHHNGEVVPEVDKTITTSDDSSMASQDSLADAVPVVDGLTHFIMGPCEEDQEVNLGAKSPEESVKEEVENDLYRMDWECDLGASKITHDIDIEAEMVEEKHVQPDSFGAVGEEDQGGTSEVGNSGTSNKVLKLPNDNPEAQCEADITAETCDEENPCARECGVTDTSLCEDIPIFEQGDQLHECTAEEMPLVVLDFEVEKEVIKEGPENETSGEPKEATYESLHNQQMVSGDQTTELPIFEGAMEESKPKSSTFLTDAPQQHKDVPELLTLSSEGPVSVASLDNGEQIDGRIMEENEKLRNMVEKLLASGKEQQDVISSLSAKVKDLEKKVSKRSKMRSGKRPGVVISRGKPLTAR